MIIEIMENGIYKSIDMENNNKVLLTITSLGNNIYRAVNTTLDITAEVLPINEYQTSIKCIEHKRADKNGRFKKTTKLLNHDLSWFDYILEEKRFIRKKKCVE